MQTSTKKDEPLKMTLDHRGRILIPKTLRDCSRFKPGSRVRVSHDVEGKIYIEAVTKRSKHQG